MRPAKAYRQTERGLQSEVVYPRTVRECILAMALTLGDGVEVDHHGQIGTGTRRERDKALIALGMGAARNARYPDGDE